MSRADREHDSGVIANGIPGKQIEGDGFTCQLEAIKAYAAANVISIAKICREEGVTGTLGGMNRPALVEMVGRNSPRSG